MSNAKIQLKEFIDSYKDSLGLEGAEQLMKQVLMKAAIPAHQTDFTKDEALRVCRELKQYSGFIGIIGGILNSRIIIR